MKSISSLQKTNRTLNDLFVLLVLILASVFVVYFSTQAVARIFFVLILFGFMLTKRDYIWFAYFFIIAQGPGYFFADFSGASAYRLPLFTFLPGFSFTPIDLFIILAFIKALFVGARVQLYLRKPLVILVLYAAFVITVTTVIFGASIETVAWNMRWVFYYSVIISFLYLVRDDHEVHRFMFVILPVVFFILFTQIYFIVMGSEFINLFNPGFRSVAINTATGELRPIMGGVLIVFISYLAGLFLLESGERLAPKFYFHVVIAASFLSVFLSATRIWFVIFSVVFVIFILISRRKVASLLGATSLVLVMVSLLLYFGVIPQDLLVRGSWGRLQQVFGIASGNVYAVDTARARIFGLSLLLKVIRQNPFLGYGFSDITMGNYDGDLGFFNTILMFGVVGLGFMLYFFVEIFRTLFRRIKCLNAMESQKAAAKIMMVAWVGILVGYFSTWDFFSMVDYKIFFVAIMVSLTEFYVRKSNYAQFT